MEAWSEYERSRQVTPAVGPALAKRGLRLSIAVLSSCMSLRHRLIVARNERATLTSVQSPHPAWLSLEVA
jgi:hypothetical protein